MDEQSKIFQHKIKTFLSDKAMYFGAAVNTDVLIKDPDYTSTLINEFNMISPENAMKWWAVHPSYEKYTFDASDKLVSFSQANNMKVRGHTLIWSKGLPEWAKSITKNFDFNSLFEEHIIKVTNRYKGKIYAWDVINEPFLDTGELENNKFLQAIGQKYIERALTLTNQADPSAKLFINEWGADEVNPKSNALYELAKKLLKRKIPLHGIGFQMHMSIGECEWMQSVPNFESVHKNLLRFSDLGLEVHITEIDIMMKTGTGTVEEKLKQQAKAYGEIMRAVIDIPRFKAFVVWGVNDKYSWLGPSSKEQDLPLLFDVDNKPKLAYFKIEEVLEESMLR